MHIVNPDALREWLTTVLEPLCDADPAALARYVLALLKKDKPVKELHPTMLDQLDVFLGQETRPFLDKLLSVINNESYLVGATTNSSTVPVASEAIVDKDADEMAPIASNSSTSGSVQGVTMPASPPAVAQDRAQSREPSQNVALETDAGALPSSHSNNGSTQHHSPIKAPPSAAAADPMHAQGTQQRRHRVSDRDRSSRSRSPIDRRSGGHGSSQGNARDSRNSARNVGMQSNRRYDRRGKRAGSPNRGNYSRRHSRSRSPSPPFYRKAGSQSPNADHQGGSQPRIQSQIGAIKGSAANGTGSGQRCRDFEEKGYCMRGETCPWDHGVDPVVLEDINNSAALMTSIQQQQPRHIREYNPDAPDLWPRASGPFPGGAGPPRGGMAPVGGAVAPVGMRLGPGPIIPGGVDYPRMPFRGGNGGVGSGLAPGMPLNNRELIPVPVIMMNPGNDPHSQGPPMHHHPHHPMDGPKRRYDNLHVNNMGPGHLPLSGEGGPGGPGPIKRKPLHSRMGPRLGPGGGGGPGGSGGPGSGMLQNCALELRKVPRGLNSIAHLNNHFSKFGKIVNIHVNYDNDPEAAIVTFSAHAEANVANRSTEAVLNNRFIKVFWHNPPKDDGQGGKEDQQPNVRKPGFPNQYQLNNLTNNNNNNSNSTVNHNVTKVGGDQENTATNTDEAQNASQAAGAPLVATLHRTKASTRVNRKRQQQEEQVKVAVQLATRKHELLQEYLKQMRSCLELIDRVEASDPQRAKLLQTVKDLQESVDKLRKEIAAEQAVQMTGAAAATVGGIQPRKTKEQQQKELLDMELELIAQQQEGHDTTVVQKKIFDLQRALGIRTPSGFLRGGVAGGRGNLAGRPMANAVPPGSTSVDRRPSTLFITGFNLDDSDALLGHFKHFGEITKHVLDKNIPSLIISFAVRTHAEHAVNRGRIFKEKPLKINWYIPNFVKPVDRAAAPKSDANAKPMGENISGDGTQATEGEGVTESSNAEGGAGCGDVLEKRQSSVAGGGAAESEVPSTDMMRLDEEEEEEEEEEDGENEDRSWRR